MKDDLAGGCLPSRYFGANAAWWGAMIMALNLKCRGLLLGSAILGTDSALQASCDPCGTGEEASLSTLSARGGGSWAAASGVDFEGRVGYCFARHL
jgi:hypothetical protein